LKGHFFFGGIGPTSGYFARSVCHFFTSSGVFVAVDNAISRSRARGEADRARRRDRFLPLLKALVAGPRERFVVGVLRRGRQRFAEPQQSVQPFLDSQARHTFEVGSVGG
jgi:hypothetical protein